MFAAGRYHVVGVQESSGRVYQNTYAGAWSGWENLDGSAVGGPAMTVNGTWTGAWTGWQSLGGDFR